MAKVYFDVDKEDVYELATDILKPIVVIMEELTGIKPDSSMAPEVEKTILNLDMDANFVCDGIASEVSQELAEEVLERALYYCPVDTGRLKESGHIERINDNNCLVVFDCPYAWYVHEHTWKDHDYPTCAKFLSIAVEEVKKLHNL